jgi:glycosyltransferase involved in cell wall biosynthesis
MKEPRVSVVIPMFNAERYIARAVGSALSSELQDLEILVLDDGSTDGSREVVRTFTDPRVTLVPLPASGGPARPRNIGISHSRAPFVALLDSDDLLKPDYLASAVIGLERYPQAALAIADFEKIDVSDAVLQTSVHSADHAVLNLVRQHLDSTWQLLSPTELQRGLLIHNFIGTSGVVLRKTAISEVGPFDESLVFAEDHDLWLRIAHRFGALYRDAIGHSLRIRPGSMTFDLTVRSRQDRIEVLSRERRRRTINAERKQLMSMIAEDFTKLGYLYRRRRERVRAAAAFARAFVRGPSLVRMKALVGSLVRADPTR